MINTAKSRLRFSWQNHKEALIHTRSKVFFVSAASQKGVEEEAASERFVSKEQPKEDFRISKQRLRLHHDTFPFVSPAQVPLSSSCGFVFYSLQLQFSQTMQDRNLYLSLPNWVAQHGVSIILEIEASARNSQNLRCEVSSCSFQFA